MSGLVLRCFRRAQRLSASGRGTLAEAANFAAVSKRAQRLSASGRGTPDRQGAPIDRHMCSTPFGIREGDTFASLGKTSNIIGVLNAFRHQGGGHSSVCLGTIHRVFCAQRLSASGRGTRHLKRHQRIRGFVLNAFRHQGGGHQARYIGRAVMGLCSTPFGIREGDTPSQASPTYSGLCAQRLSASGRGTR